MRVAGQLDARIVLAGRLEYLESERAVEKLAIDIVHVGLEEAVLAAIGQVGIVFVGQFRLAQLILGKDDEVVVQHANAGHAGRGQRPGGIEAGFAGQHQRFVRVGVELQHVVEDDLVHPVPDVFDVVGNLGAANRPAERVEHALRGVVDDRRVEGGAVPERLAVEQQIFRVHQQAVVVNQVVEVFRAVEELVRLHPFRYVQRNWPVRGGDFTRTVARHGVLPKVDIGPAFYHKYSASRRQPVGSVLDRTIPALPCDGSRQGRG